MKLVEVGTNPRSRVKVVISFLGHALSDGGESFPSFQFYINTLDCPVSSSPLSPRDRIPLRLSHEVRRVFYLLPPRLRRERVSHRGYVSDQSSRHQHSMHRAHLPRLVEAQSLAVSAWSSNMTPGLGKVKFPRFPHQPTFAHRDTSAPFSLVSTLRRVLGPEF